MGSGRAGETHRQLTSYHMAGEVGRGWGDNVILDSPTRLCSHSLPLWWRESKVPNFLLQEVDTDRVSMYIPIAVV